MKNRHWEQLIQRWQNNQLPHALLLSGTSSNADKQQFALRFAQLLLCQQNSLSEKACNNCHACHLFNANTHTDLHCIQPIETGKMIRIDQIRGLTNQLSQTAQQGRYKIIIINPAEALHNAAVNALLKTLEEPTPQTLFFLIAENPRLLPATLRSRCQTLVFDEDNSSSAHQTESCQRLLDDLKQLDEHKIDPIKLANRWMKEPLADIIHHLTLFVTDKIKSQTKIQKKSQKLFCYLDQLYQLRKNSQNNLNQQLLLENLFYGWQEL